MSANVSETSAAVPIKPGSGFWIFLIAVLAGGCSAGNGEGLDISGRPLEEGSQLALAPTLASIQSNVFDPYCAVCHSGANAPLGLRLDAASSFTNLVSVRSREASSLFRVAPGNPDQSYLIRKLEGTASTGEQMPLGGPPIPQSTIDYVRQWITDGAQPAATAPNNSAPIIVSLSLSPDSVIGSLPSEISVGFDKDLDASTINEQTFTLLRSGGDGVFGDGNDVAVMAVSVGLSPGNPRLAFMDLTGAPAVADLYRLTLAGSGVNMILDLEGRALDGDFSGNFPTGDGVEGGNFVISFEVMGLQATLDAIQASIFSVSCATAGCHSGPPGTTLPTGMDLTSADASFSSLVNVASIEVPQLDRVKPGDADSSYLVQKLDGTSAIGQRMPRGGPYLDQESMDAIRLWINNGAER